MKTKKFNRKLVLNKKTITNLTTQKMEAIRGGDGTQFWKDTCYLSMVICPITDEITDSCAPTCNHNCP